MPSPDGQQAILYNNQPSAQLSLLSLKNSNLQVICNKRQSSKIIDAVSFRTQVHDFGLATLAQDGEVFLWDVRNMMKCVQTIKTEGVVRASRLAVNPKNGKQLAVAGHTKWSKNCKENFGLEIYLLIFDIFLSALSVYTNSVTLVYLTI